MRPARSRSAVALAAVAAVAAAGCCRLFGDAGWVVPVFSAVVCAHIVGALTRRWSVWPAAVAHGAGLMLLLTESVGGHTAYGVPTPATFSALGRAAGHAPDALRAAIVPAPTTAELILPVVAGLWVASAAAGGLAQRRRAGLLSVVPLTVFPVVVAALGTDRLRTTLTFAFAAGTALYAAVDRDAQLPTTQARLLRSGPVQARRTLLPSNGFVRSGAVVAIGLAAVVLGPVAPGVGRAVVDVHAFGVALDVSRVELNPLVDIRPQLLTPRRTELFTVRATAPAYWRLTALDRFDGRRWSPSRPALFRRHGPSVDSDVTGDRALHQDFWLSALDSPWLPAADKAISVKAAGARLDPETDSLVTKKGSRAVRAYRVESRLPRDPFEQPRAAGRPPGGVPGLARYLALPSGFPRAVRELAERFTAGAETPYDQAVALEDSLRVGFIYDENAAPGASVDALDDFLFGSHRGYCEQFAGAYAAMARSLGLPTRVAVGFTPGTYDAANGVWRVTTREAHAWPEVYLAGAGWTAFEPTPGRVLPEPDAWRPPTELERVVDSRSPGRNEASALARIDPGGGAGLDSGPANRPGGLGAVAHHRVVWWCAALGLGLVIVPPVAKSRRRVIRRRARADEAVLAAWREALDRLSEAGLTRRGEETPLEFARRAGAARPGAAPAMRRLAVLVNSAAYGLPEGNGGVEAWAASDRVVKAIDDHDAGWVRWRRRLDPRTLFPR